jgi:hypothetical protein
MTMPHPLAAFAPILLRFVNWHWIDCRKRIEGCILNCEESTMPVRNLDFHWPHEAWAP